MDYDAGMDRPARVRAELERQISVARHAQDAGPPCRDCQFATLLGHCSNAAYYSQAFDPVSGNLSICYNTPLAVARSENGLCGPEALLWTPLSKPRALSRMVQASLNAHPFRCLFGIFLLWAAVDLLF